MTAKNVQHDIVDSNPGRINVMVDVQAEDGKKKVELPLRLLTIGDFTGRENATPIIEREPINVNKDNFDGVLRSLDVQADYVVTHGAGDAEEDTQVHLEFDTLSDFHPEAVARQVPKILELVAARNLLQDLRNRVINASEFRKGLEEIVRDADARKQLAAELDRVMGGHVGAPSNRTHSH
jgi:type VI secretion system protein ImpB